MDELPAEYQRKIRQAVNEQRKLMGMKERSILGEARRPFLECLEALTEEW
jgi:hypothetical protein